MKLFTTTHQGLIYQIKFNLNSDVFYFYLKFSIAEAKLMKVLIRCSLALTGFRMKRLILIFDPLITKMKVKVSVFPSFHHTVTSLKPLFLSDQRL